MLKTIGTVCVGMALFLDTVSYWKQIVKTIKAKKSSQVSSSSYLFKIAKALFSMTGLAIYFNWVGFGMEAFMLIVYAISLIIIAKYKPRGWRLF
jgi:uncharacterized protein with PQ loop repeat